MTDKQDIINDCFEIHTQSIYYRYLNKRNTPMFTQRQFRMMVALVELIDHENVVLIGRKALCQVLQVRPNNLNRTLDRLSHLVIATTSMNDKNVPRGCLKLEVNPAYGWKPSEDKTREQAIREWYLLTECGEACSKDFYFKAVYQHQPS